MYKSQTKESAPKTTLHSELDKAIRTALGRQTKVSAHSKYQGERRFEESNDDHRIKHVDQLKSEPLQHKRSLILSEVRVVLVISHSDINLVVQNIQKFYDQSVHDYETVLEGGVSSCRLAHVLALEKQFNERLDLSGGEGGSYGDSE